MKSRHGIALTALLHLRSLPQALVDGFWFCDW